MSNVTSTSVQRISNNTMPLSMLLQAQRIAANISCNDSADYNDRRVSNPAILQIEKAHIRSTSKVIQKYAATKKEAPVYHLKVGLRLIYYFACLDVLLFLGCELFLFSHILDLQ